MRELFVWYRVPGDRCADARRAVLGMQRSLCAQWPGLDARVLTRAEADATVQTWMETYAHPGRESGVDASIETAIAESASALAALIEGNRHTEAFVAVLPAGQSTRDIAT